MPIVVMKCCDLNLASGSNLALGRHFLMPAVLQDRLAVAPKQRREGVKLVESSSRNSAALRHIGFERRRAAGHRSKYQRSGPLVSGADLEFRTRANRRSCRAKPDINVFTAIAKRYVIAESDRAALIHA